MSTRVVHFKKENYDIYIGRGSKWGNNYTHIKDRPTKAKYIVDTIQEALEKYRVDVLSNPELMNSLHELKDKTLGCWCLKTPIDYVREQKRCHGEVLLELINIYCTT
jgi:hypothetical protein